MRHPATMTTEQIESYRASFVGSSSGEVRRQDLDGGVVFLSERHGQFYATGFVGKAIKPAFHYYFRSEPARDEYVSKFARSLQARAQDRAQRAEARKNDTHGLMVGSILFSSWGYEQSNVDWYQVIAVISDKTVVIQKIAASIEDTGSMCGNSRPVPGRFVGEPMRKRATSNGIALTSFSTAFAWDGQPKYCSWYA